MSETQRVSKSRGQSSTRLVRETAFSGSLETHPGSTPAWTSSHVATPFALGGLVQPKVVIGRINDPYEREADQVADRVTSGVRILPSSISRVTPGNLGPPAQRQAETETEEEEEEETSSETPVQLQASDSTEAEEEPEEETEEEAPEPVQTLTVQSKADDLQIQTVQRQAEAEEEETEEAEEEEPVQTKASQPATSSELNRMSGAATRAIEMRDAGAPLGLGMQRSLEPKFQTDLSDIRVHTGFAAEQAASDMKARAFTHEKDIFLGRHESPTDTRLMAHEVTHVLQQDGIVRRKPQPPEEEEKEEEKEKRKREEELAAGAPRRLETPPPAEAAPVPEVIPPEKRTPEPKPALPEGTERPAAGATELPGIREPMPSLEVAGISNVLEKEEEKKETEGLKKEEEAAEREPAPEEVLPEEGAAEAKPAVPLEEAAAEVAPATEAAPPTAVVARRPEVPGVPPVAEVAEVKPGEEKAVEVPAAAVVPVPEAAAAVALEAEMDPRFQQAQARLESLARKERRHAPVRSKVKAAERATVQPENEPLAKGMGARVDEMSRQEAGKPEEMSFLQLMEAALKRLTPETPEDVENFGEKGTGGEALRAEIKGGVAKQEAKSKGAIESATKREPVEIGKETAEQLPPEKTERPPGRVNAADALPEPKLEFEISMEADKQQAEAELAKTGLTEEQLVKANEPEFTAALAAKQEVMENSEAAPQRYREKEKEYVSRSTKEAKEEENTARLNMRRVRQGSNKRTRERQLSLKKKREEERRRVSTDLQKIYAETKKNVEEKLLKLDGDVDRLFDEGHKTAFEKMKNNVARRLRAWKLRRYGSRAAIPVVGVLVAAGTWVYDKARGIDHIPEVKQIYTEERDGYLREMKALFTRIANLVERTLQQCKEEIAKGRTRIKEYVNSLGPNLRAYGRDAQKSIFGEFSSLEEGVDAKKGELAERMASRYKESREQVDKWIEEERARNKGLISKLVDKVRGIIETIRKLKDRLMAALGKGKAAIGIIIGDPIGFLGNILDAVKQGFFQFKENIVEHLKVGLLGWLFGTLGSAGITIPKDFSLKSIFGLVLEILGITKAKIRAKAVKLIGERNVAMIEKAWEFISTLISEGPAGLWEKIKAYLSDLKDTIIEGVKEWVISQIIKQAVLKLVSMFNPVGAFIQACLAIYNVVMFFVERIHQIIELVEAVINSVYDIATGKIAAAANWIEKTMARTIPIIISFLARLLGLSGISDKIKGIISKIQAKVDRAIDKVIKKIVGGIGKLLGKGKAKRPPADASPEVKERWVKGQTAIDDLKARADRDPFDEKTIASELGRIKKTYQFRILSFKREGDEWVITSGMSKTDTDRAKAAGKEWPTGERSDPIPIKWYKPENIYPKIGGKGPREGITLPATARKKARRLEVSSPNFLQEGRVLSRREPGRPPEDRKEDIRYRLNLEKNKGQGGLYVDHPNFAIDHVRDLAWFGQDLYTNLWPLDSGVNNAVNASHNQYVRALRRGKVETHSVKTWGTSKYFGIAKIENPPASPGGHGTSRNAPMNIGKDKTGVPKRMP